MKRYKTMLKVSKILFHTSFVLYALAATASPILLGNAGIINTSLGIETQISNSASSDGNTYFDTKYSNMAEVKQASLDIIEETVSEGVVLLKNDNQTLPLSTGSSVTLYGAASYYAVYTGMGSSSIKYTLSDKVTFYDGLTNAGLNVNSELNDWYKENGTDCLGGSNFSGYESQETQFVVKDMAWDSLPSAKSTAADTAIMVLARNSGEAIDLYMDTTMADDETRVIVSRDNNNSVSGSVGDSLELAENEKDVLSHLKQLKESGTIKNIVVLMNTASPMQSEFLNSEDYDIDACMWVGNLGQNGATAVGKLLTGEYNPSGKTSDTFFANSKYNPVYYNFGEFKYNEADTYLENYFATRGAYNNKYYVAYQEGIYNGYKYTETRYEDTVTGRENVGSFDYDTVVSYPFGYGLSYSSFTYSNMKVEKNSEEDTYKVSVDVTNNSNIEGKEAVQIYLQKPYTATDITNGVEKASVELIGFEKATVPANSTVTVTTEVQGKYFAAYDSNVEKTYVIGSKDEKDDYLLTAAKDSHDAINNILQYKSQNGHSVDTSKMTSLPGRDLGNSSLVWATHFDYDTTTYSTNDYIEEQNENFEADYVGQEANYGVSKITNQFDDTDYTKSSYFSEEETSQPYMTRSNWTGTYGIQVELTASEALKVAQENPTVEKDTIPYPTYGETGFYEGADMFDEIKLIYLRGKDYDDDLWDTLLDRITWEETCAFLQDALRYTNGIDSISCPSTSQQNGALAPVHSRTDGAIPEQTAFRGFAEEKDPDNASQKPAVFACNGIVASTYNKDLILRLGEQTGEEAAWAGYNGIYGLGVNIHRGAYCGRTFEYYSEDGYLTGVAAGYEAVGLHKMGVFVLAKHAVLNDQETHRAGLNVWANEQSIREIYSRALEVAIEIDQEYTPNSVLGVMTGMNRLGAKWTGGQGFLNTVLRAEYGMTSYAISDYNSSRPYMSPIQGVLYGNDLPDGNPAGSRSGYDYDGNDIRFTSYESGYGELAWSMRTAVKNVLYTVVNSNSMNGITGDTSFTTIVPTWQKVVPITTRVLMTLFIWCTVAFSALWIYHFSLDMYDQQKLKKEEDK